MLNNVGNNILAYSEYIKEIISNNQIDYLVNFMNMDKQNEIDIYWRSLSRYEEYNVFFEKEFIKHLRNARFDYSLVNLTILERNDEELYKLKKKECQNMIKKILYHGTQKDSIASILTNEFRYAKRAFYGMGIYFTESIDYVTFYCGGNNFYNRRDNFGKIIGINDNFSFIASEIFYDQTKLKQIKDKSLLIEDLDIYPTYEYLKINYPDKMIEPNGVHYIQVDVNGDPIDDNAYKYKLQNGEFIADEYAITELYQIFPIYSLTLKRNEYFVLWRDPNFEGQNIFSESLIQLKLFLNQKANMNIYYETSTEEALKFLWRRRYNKVILITSIGPDQSGKVFVDIARKIFQFDIMVLFFALNTNHLEWIKNYNNCLYTNNKDILKEYITNFNEYGLKCLKKKVENTYNITLKEFTNNFLYYPLFINEEYYCNSFINYNETNPYIREVYIFCEKKKMYLIMTKDGNILSSLKPTMWDVIIMDKEIILYSNGFYLGINEDNENVIGVKYMKKWLYEKNNNYYSFFNEKSKLYLSMGGSWVKVNKNENGLFEQFILIEKDNY